MFEDLPLNEMGFVGTIIGLGTIAIIIGCFFLIALYIYMSSVFSAIGKRSKKVKNPGIAWIPIIGPMIVSYKCSKMHWWPWLLLIAFIIPFVNFVAIAIFAVYQYIWMWKTFEAVKRPGWWALIPLIGLVAIIPIIGWIIQFIVTVIYFILLGVAAWSKK